MTSSGGGDDVSLERQGEADPNIDMMGDLALSSLLSRGTKTWHSGDHETTIDLVPASEELKEATIRCTTHETEHGTDHRTIETIFEVSVPVPGHQERILPQERAVERDQSQNREHTRSRPERGNGAAEDRQPDVSSARGRSRSHTQGATIAVRQTKLEL